MPTTYLAQKNTFNKDYWVRGIITHFNIEHNFNESILIIIITL